MFEIVEKKYTGIIKSKLFSLLVNETGQSLISMQMALSGKRAYAVTSVIPVVLINKIFKIVTNQVWLTNQPKFIQFFPNNLYNRNNFNLQ
jgi:hypothetical protein